MEWLSGEPFAADDESTEARWFDLDELPPMTENMRQRITLSAGDDEGTIFDTNGPQAPDPSR